METVQKTIWQMIRAVAEEMPNNEALIHTEIGVRYNYSLFLWEVERAAGGLIKMGVRKGDRVALWAPNIPEWIIAQIALARIGAVLVPIDPGIEGEDLRYILDQSESRFLIMARGLEGDEYVDMILRVRDKTPCLEHIVVIATQTFPDMNPWSEMTAMEDKAGARRLREREESIGPEDPVAIMYTSGTTGKPKGVVLDHLGLINKSLHSTERQGIGPKDRLCLFFPLFHMFGNTCIALAGLLRGSAVIMPCLAFDPVKILKTIEKERCTALYGSPSMIIALLDHPNFKKVKWATVKKGILGGAPCPMELMKKIVQDVGVSDITVSYGITETSSWITMTHPDDPLDLRVSTIGTPLACCEVKIVDPETGAELPPITQGELCTRGFLMKGYYKMPAATAAALDRDGWFHSGDLGEMDEKGYLKITGRLKDVIVRDGREVQPTEVEEVIYGLPEVSEVQVFGVPHAGRGQEMTAWIKLKEGAALSMASLKRYTQRHLEKEKAPDYYKFVRAFPMTRSGKVQKFRMAEMAARESGERV
jgi:fatty-acyl-CoA synthase